MLNFSWWYIDYIYCNIYFRIRAFDVFLHCFGRVKVISYMYQSRCFSRKLFLLNQSYRLRKTNIVLRKMVGKGEDPFLLGS